MARSDFEQMLNHADHPEHGPCGCSMCVRDRVQSVHPTPLEALESGQRVNPFAENSPEGREWRAEFYRLERKP